MKMIFTAWTKWSERGNLDRLNYPGVYVIALTERNISACKFSWRSEIIYIGMTNARGGLRSRLQQFDNTIKGRGGHGGARRVRFKYPEYAKLKPKLYVSICPYICDVKSNRPADLRIMGDVEKCEYECFAIFIERFVRLPEFNDKTRSPKM